MMHISVVSGTPDARTADLLVYPGFALPSAGADEADDAKGKGARKKGKKAARTHKAAGTEPGFGKHLADVDDALGGLLSATAKDEGFTGAAGQTFLLHTHGRIAARRVALIGVGAADALDVDGVRKLAAAAIKAGDKVKAKVVVLVLPEEGALRADARVEAAAEGALLAAYRFNRYLTKDKEKSASTVEELEIAAAVRAKTAAAAVERARAVADGVCLARDLVNEPAGTLTPVELAKRASAAGKEHGFEVEILDEKELARERMGMLLAVAQAASPYRPPRVVKLSYRGGKKGKKKVALVGKGLTFDSGGLDIKPADGMLDMKVDMSGAAAVLGAFVALARLKPRVTLTGWLGCVENGVGGNAYHPGDVLTSRKGLTVEVNNTDAEGRLVLADCIDLAITEAKPDLLVDLATLTGACMVALGPTTAAIFTDDDELAEDIRTAGKRAGEDFWRLPLNPALQEQLKSNVADCKNTGLRFGGAITAALFLKQFVDGRTSWAHLDIAGPADTDRDSDYTAKGGVGFGVRTLVGLIDPQ
ncbi:MAG: leucyl aminopeptidase [Deltaproteobacteria bacterium]|nr:leucyl aminopeptidase [Deltaproteobacteria bacterium]